MVTSDFRPEVEIWPFRARLLINEWPEVPRPIAFLLATNCNF